MICPLCKNEKWDAETCPKCGLDNKEALLTKAKELKLAERYLEAGDLFQKFIKLEPGHKLGLSLLATCLSIEAIKSHDFELFDRSRLALKQALDAEWTWERGHQFQIDLYICFGRQRELIKNYEQLSLSDESKKDICENMIKIILLAEKFQETPPSVSTNVTSDLGYLAFLKKYWVLVLGLFLLLWSIYEIPNISTGTGEKGAFLALFVFLILGAGVIVLILLSMHTYRKNNDKEKGKNID